ncbi:hypothetical protein B0T20DRAFT_151596 [Sordaria brevicollis]|uniref:Uncharacterized protein n=1 Tax=Sordaria brevicollis TaxID=83679 RepID=A0AAE0UED1_SORBR|nr:hypothetical protein B0T20DRAFT_151596 [Sordaria brevicollis]
MCDWHRPGHHSGHDVKYILGWHSLLSRWGAFTAPNRHPQLYKPIAMPPRLRRSSRISGRPKLNYQDPTTPEREPRPSTFNVFPRIEGLQSQTCTSLVSNMFTMLEFLPPELVACGGNLDQLPQDTEMEVKNIYSDQDFSWQRLKSDFWQDDRELERFKRYAKSIYKEIHGNDYFEAGRPPPAYEINPADGRLMNPEPWKDYAEELAYRAFEEIGIGPFEFTVTFSHIMFWEKGCIWNLPDRDSERNDQVGTLLLVLKGQHNGGGISIHCEKRCFFHPERPPLGDEEVGPCDAEPYWVAA